jgi:YD repeat-containing protein
MRDPAAALADALSAACRQDQAAFATHLTAANAATFRALPDPRRSALLKRFVLLDDAGKPLLSTTAEGRTEVRCEAAGLVSAMRLGSAEVRENLAFVTAEVGEPGGEARPVRIGLVREAGEWKLLSVGLLLLDLPALSRQWEEADLEAHEAEVIASLRKIAEALGGYQQAFGKLPEALEQLGPGSQDGISPDRAGLLDASLAGGESLGYRFRYTIKPAAVEGDESDRDKAAGFELAATPVDYGSAGRRSFYLDSKGVLRGADKHGAVATVDDPQIREPQP